jgi:serine/threonine protein kinase
MEIHNSSDPLLIANRYKPGTILGRGGIGEVREAEDTRLQNRKVALKEIRINQRDRTQNDLNFKIFEKESKLLSTLKHQGIPEIFDSFILEDKAYLVMEYINGQNLESVIKASEGGIQENNIIEWGIEIAEILKYLHRHKPPVIFRDIKPANIILQEDGKIKLVDFGIARTFSLDKKSTVLMSRGTIGYAPPEQFTENEDTDERSDIYSLGATLHHIATGRDPRQRPPFSFEPVRKIRSELSESLEIIISKCLEKEKINRYQTIEQVIRDLKKLRAGKKVAADNNPASNSSRIFTAISAIILIMGFSLLTLKHFNLFFFKKSEPLTIRCIPETDSTVPRDIKKIMLIFSAPMDRESLKEATVVFHEPIKEIQWSKGDTVCEISFDIPKLPENYEGTALKIKNNEAKDKQGRYLTNQYNPKYQWSDYLAVKYKTDHQ